MFAGRIVSSFAAALMLALTACGGLDSLLGGSCSSSGGSCTAPAGQGCLESGALSSIVQAACSNNGTYASSACSRTNAVGGCQKTTSGLCQTTWSYAPLTTEAARAACTQLQGTFVAP